MPKDLIASLLYRDGLMLVLNKPAGIPVHKGPKGGASFEDGFDSLRFGLPRPPALAHRLDRDTSGCLVLGRHRKALAKLGLLFKQGRIAKTYWAVVDGSPEAEDGLIDLPLGRRDETRGWWMKVDPLGVSAQTRWRVMGRDPSGPNGPRTWLALHPLTGRTHQLRVHCAAMGWPILGDPIYAPGATGPDPLHLHARAIEIPYSANKDPIRVVAPVPTHMAAALERCGWAQDLAAGLLAATEASLGPEAAILAQGKGLQPD